MARVTVEDCVDKVENRFMLVLLASHRARTISGGSPISIDRDNDKNPVVALREIAQQTVHPEDLEEELIHSLQKYVEVDEPEMAGGALPAASASAGGWWRARWQRSIGSMPCSTTRVVCFEGPACRRPEMRSRSTRPIRKFTRRP